MKNESGNMSQTHDDPQRFATHDLENTDEFDISESRVVVVDDDEALRMVFCRMLEGVGCRVLEAAHGEAAIRIVKKSRVDVVVSDVRMPDMNGVELLQKLREEDESVSVVLISGDPDLDTALKAIEFGASEYLKKPIDENAFVESVVRAASAAKRKRKDSATLESFRTAAHRSSSMPAPGSRSGTILGGRYRLGEKIGAGAMGAVYEATRVDSADSVVAVKVLHPRLHFDDDALSRLRLEAETVARLNHQNIVRVLDYHISPESPYLVMERLYGRPLSHLIETAAPLEVGRVVFIVVQTLFALQAAHEQGVIHRDLKPENIFLTSVSGVNDIVRVLDFGVAKLLGPEVNVRLTRTGAVMGTPLYMAPEQARGDQVDQRSDLYSIGTVLYESLTGHPPFEADNYHALLSKIQREEPLPLEQYRTDLDPKLVQLIHRCLSKEPDARFPDAFSMIEAFKPWLPSIESKTHMSQPPPAPYVGPPQSPRHLRTTRKEGGRKP